MHDQDQEQDQQHKAKVKAKTYFARPRLRFGGTQKSP